MTRTFPRFLISIFFLQLTTSWVVDARVQRCRGDMPALRMPNLSSRLISKLRVSPPEVRDLTNTLSPTKFSSSVKTVIRTHMNIVCPSKDAKLKDCPSESNVRKQIAVLNEAFNKIGFGFDVKTFRYIYQPNWYKTFIGTMGLSNNGTEMLKFGHKGTHRDLNLFVKSLREDPILGVAIHIPPDLNDGPLFTDAVVVETYTLPGQPEEPKSIGYNQGKTMIHEVGHWLGLKHTSRLDCEDTDFQFGIKDDTPASISDSYECKPIDSCPNLPGMDPIHNYMSISNDACMTEFTPGQVEIMKYVMKNIRKD